MSPIVHSILPLVRVASLVYKTLFSPFLKVLFFSLIIILLTEADTIIYTAMITGIHRVPRCVLKWFVFTIGFALLYCIYLLFVHIYNRHFTFFRFCCVLAAELDYHKSSVRKKEKKLGWKTWWYSCM